MQGQSYKAGAGIPKSLEKLERGHLSSGIIAAGRSMVKFCAAITIRGCLGAGADLSQVRRVDDAAGFIDCSQVVAIWNINPGCCYHTPSWCC